MNKLPNRLAALAVASLAVVSYALFETRAAAIQDAPASGLGGTWKLVVLAFGEDEFAVVKIDPKEGAPKGTVAAAQAQVLGDGSGLKVDPLVIRGDSLTVGLKGPAGVNVFHGKLAKDGPQAGKVLGNFMFRGEIYPARLERTKTETVSQLKQGPLVASYVGIAGDRDPKSKINKAHEAIAKIPGNPTSHLFYSELLGAAEAGGLGAAEVGAIVDRWTKEAEPYGEGWANAVRLKALKALGNSKPYAAQALKLAQQADQALGADASVETKAATVSMLAHAARLAGNNDLAAEAEARSAKLESQLDEEYHKKVPPFTPAKYEGRKKANADRVVVMELFTGAQCPPCVAADVGYDALLKTYGHKELIGLQYHLHIPGPDPMTNNDSQGRQKYYADAVRGTPSTFFNGRSEAGGGGPMQFSENKYNEYRQIIDPQLEASKDAAIELTAALHGDQLEIQAQATVDRKPLAKGDEPKAGANSKDSKGESRPGPRLRLALTEEAVRYIGGNKLRFHHHVVRAFPGGVEGKDLSSGSGQVRAKLNLADLRRELEQKNSEDAKQRPFPNPLPEIGLKDLSVVAFVQDDADKAILHAVSVPVK
jgi:hypothetical protein